MSNEQLIHLVEWQMAIFSFPLNQFFFLQLLKNCIKKGRKIFLVISANRGLLTSLKNDERQMGKRQEFLLFAKKQMRLVSGWCVYCMALVNQGKY